MGVLVYVSRNNKLTILKKKVIVIGAGFSGLSAATHLSAKGFEVTILEKNTVPG